jgi:hypothetical protein
MNLSVMPAAQRNRELIADLKPECLELSKAQVMGVGWLTPTDETRLRRNEP